MRPTEPSGDVNSAKAAIRVLMQRRTDMLAYLWSLTRDPHAAEDLLQEVSLVAVERPPKSDDPDVVFRWLLRTARYKAANYVRKHAGRAETLLGEVCDLMEVQDLVDQEWRRQSDEQNSLDLAAALDRCVRKLTPYSHRLIRLRYEEGLTGEDLATATGRSLGAVYVALSRIHSRLRDCVRALLRASELGGRAEEGLHGDA